jgi:hypothetical protein
MAKNDDTRELDKIRRRTKPEDRRQQEQFSHPIIKSGRHINANGPKPKRRS